MHKRPTHSMHTKPPTAELTPSLVAVIDQSSSAAAAALPKPHQRASIVSGRLPISTAPRFTAGSHARTDWQTPRKAFGECVSPTHPATKILFFETQEAISSQEGRGSSPKGLPCTVYAQRCRLRFSPRRRRRPRSRSRLRFGGRRSRIFIWRIRRCRDN